MPSASERLSSEASLLDEAAEITAQFGQAWLTGKGNLRSLDRRRQKLAEEAHVLGPAPTTGLHMFRDVGTDAQWFATLDDAFIAALWDGPLPPDYEVP